MIGQLLAFVPLVPSGVPLLLAFVTVAILRLIRTRRRLRVFGWVLVVGLVAASTPLWPIPGSPRQTIVWSWITWNGSDLRLGLDLGSASAPDRGALSLLLLGLGAFSCWGVCQSPAADEQARSRVLGLSALLLALGGGQLALQSVAPFGSVLGSALVILSGVLLEPWRLRRGSLMRGISRSMLLLVPLLMFLAAVLIDPGLVSTYLVWIAGCAVLLILSLVHGATGMSPLSLAGSIHALGITPVVVCLMLWTKPLFTSYPMIVDAATLVGSLLFVLGAVNVAVSSSLRGLFYTQWAAQSGMLILALGKREFTPALGQLIVSSLLLSLVLGWLAEVSATERIAGLPAFPGPLRRLTLAYALVAASVSGLPLTLGYTLRRALVAQTEAAYVAPLLLGGSTLLICGLLQPLAALVRTTGAEISPVEPPTPLEAGSTTLVVPLAHTAPGQDEALSAPSSLEEGLEEASAMQGTEELPPENPEVDAPEDPAPSEDEFLEGWRGGILLGLLLVFAAPYPVLFTIGDALARLYSIDGLVALIAERREMLIVAALQVAPVLLMLGFASRALRRRVVPPPFGRMPVVREHGWALPPAGLAGVVAPLTLGFWAGLGRLYPRRTAVLLGTGIMALLLVVWGATWRP